MTINLEKSETIAAIATALGEASVGIVRISGCTALGIANSILTKSLCNKVRFMQYCYVENNGEKVDEVLAVYMPAPHSYTAEDVVEIHCHGGVATTKKILQLCLDQGARLAEPGEFTKRAFLNGRIDLTQAEAVMDIIRAKSETSLKMALRAQQGELSKQIRDLRQNLLDVVVHLEAEIDYPEDDIEETTYTRVVSVLIEVKKIILQLLVTGHTGKILREGLNVAIVGRPNVGKSSLLNALLQENRAIVSEYAGTTRDVIEEQMLVEGIPVVLTDTAGIRRTDNAVEQLGVIRSKNALKQAQLILWVVDSSELLSNEDYEIKNQLPKEKVLVIVHKSDLSAKIQKNELDGLPYIEVSSKNGAGLEELRAYLRQFAYRDNTGNSGVFVENLRHINLLQKADRALDGAIEAAEKFMPYDCIIVDVRNAITALGKITGDNVTDEIINKIFAKFCVGK